MVPKFFLLKQNFLQLETNILKKLRNLTEKVFCVNFHHFPLEELIYFIGFEDIKFRRRDKLSKNKEVSQKWTFWYRIKLDDIFDFTDQDKITNGLGYKFFETW